ncbi:MAG: YhdP family protein [Gammaproteobacteria bacterium]
MQGIALRGIAPTLWHLGSRCVPLVAVLAWTLRLALPPLLSDAGRIELGLEQLLGRPIAVAGVTFAWRGWRPALTLNDLQVLDRAGRHALLRFREAEGQVDVLASLYRGHLQLGNLRLSGARFGLVRGADGRVAVEGIEDSGDDVLRWLLAQPRLRLEAPLVPWRDVRSGQGPWDLGEVWIASERHGQEQRLQIGLRPPEAIGGPIMGWLIATDDLLRGGGSGDFYLRAQDLKLHTFKPQLAQGLTVEEGSLDLRTWGRWQGGRLRTAVGAVDLDAARLAAGDSELPLARLAGRFQLVRRNRGRWDLGVTELRLGEGKTAAPATLRMSVIHEDAGRPARILAHADALGAPWLALLQPLIAGQGHSGRSGLSASGELRDVWLAYRPGRADPGRYYVRTEVTGVGWTGLPGWPDVQGLNGRLEADAGAGRLVLARGPARVSLGQVMEHPIDLDELGGELRWRRDAGQWRVTSPALRVSNRDLSLKAAGSVRGAAGESPSVDVVVQVAGGTVESAYRYLPRSVPEGVRQWLARSLRAGTVTGGGLVWQGRLADFPYDARQGYFLAELAVQDGVLDYHAAWPRIEALTGVVTFEGRGMRIRAQRGLVAGARIGGAEADIADLAGSPARLLVRGQARAPAVAGREFVLHSPLQDRLGTRLEPVSASGDLGLDLELDIPLGGAAGEPKVAGTLELLGNGLRAEGFDLSHLRGKLSFSDGDLSGNRVQAELHGLPVTIDLSSRDQGADSVATLSGRASRAFIEARLIELAPALRDHRAWLDAVQGETDWQLRWTASGNGASAKGAVRLSSDLRGLRLALPAPLGKPAGEGRRFEVRAGLPLQRDAALELSYGNVLNLNLYPGEAEGPWRVHARLGQRRPAMAPDAPVWVGGNLEAISIDEWVDFLGQGQGAGRFKLPAGAVLDVIASRIEVSGFRFDRVHVKARSDGQRWNLQLDGPDASGSVQVPLRAAEGTLEAALKWLRLKPVATRHAYDPDPRRLPAVKLYCAGFNYDGIDLGELSLKAQPGGRGLSVYDTSFSAPGLQIKALGIWEIERATHSSRFDIEVQSTDLGKLLGRFGYQTAQIEGGETRLHLHARWPGRPSDFALSELDGSVELEVKNGQLLDVEQGMGRVFGLLSVNALWRRLRLDFSDVYEQGLAFDRIEGAFLVDNGDAYTNRLTLRGPAASIELSGRTGLAKRDYDQTITVTPAVAGSLPVAGAFFGPAGLGVGAAVLLAEGIFDAIPENIDRVFSRHYHLTGSWEDPRLQRIDTEELRKRASPKVPLGMR